VSGVYGLDSPGQTWQLGKSIAQLDGDAASYGSRLVAALGDVDVGGDGQGKSVNAAVHSFQTDTADGSHHLAHEVGKLGDSVIAGAVEAAETDNAGARVANTVLSRIVNTVFSSPSAD